MWQLSSIVIKMNNRIIPYKFLLVGLYFILEQLQQLHKLAYCV
jgi:hypothetical protein